MLWTISEDLLLQDAKAALSCGTSHVICLCIWTMFHKLNAEQMRAYNIIAKVCEHVSHHKMVQASLMAVISCLNMSEAL